MSLDVATCLLGWVGVQNRPDGEPVCWHPPLSENHHISPGLSISRLLDFLTQSPPCYEPINISSWSEPSRNHKLSMSALTQNPLAAPHHPQSTVQTLQHGFQGRTAVWLMSVSPTLSLAPPYLALHADHAKLLLVGRAQYALQCLHAFRQAVLLPVIPLFLV